MSTLHKADPVSPRENTKLTIAIEDELWKRAETRRELELYPEVSPEDRLLLPLILSLARLAAQQDAKAHLASNRTYSDVE